jgi:hypothetical protein
MKTCKACQAPKELSEFYKDPIMKDGHYAECKTCVIERVNRRAEQKVNSRYFDVDKEMRYYKTA